MQKYSFAWFEMITMALLYCTTIGFATLATVAYTGGYDGIALDMNKVGEMFFEVMALWVISILGGILFVKRMMDYLKRWEDGKEES